MFAGVPAGFFDWVCAEGAGAGLVCASLRSAPLYAVDAATVRIKIANRFEKSDTVRKTFLRGRDVFDSIVARPMRGAAKFRMKIPRVE